MSDRSVSDTTHENRREIDPVFKQVIEDEFAVYQATCQTEFEVSRLPRTIDAVITIENENERQKICAETPFFYFLRDNQIEFKGSNDRLTDRNYHAIRGRMEFLLYEKKISPLSTTVTIVSAGKPRSVLAYAQTLGQPFTAIEAGYYKCEQHPQIYLIVVNELPIISKNYPLLVFASSEHKFREFLEQVVAKGNSTYIRYAYEVRPHITKEVLTMAGTSSRLSRKELKFIVDDIGAEIIPLLEPEDVVKGMNAQKRKKLVSLFEPEDVLAAMSVEDRLSGVSAKDRLSGVSAKDRLSGVSAKDRLSGVDVAELLKDISPEQRKMLFELVLKQLASDLAGKEPNGHSDN